MNNTIKTEVTDLCGDLLKYTAILKQQQRCKKTKNVWVWEDVANRRTVLNCQSSAMWLKSSALWAARVWSNNYKIDGYFIGCWHLSVTYTAKLLVLGDVGTEKQELYIYLKYWVTKSAITHLTETKPRLATVMYCMGTDLTPPPTRVIFKYMP